MKPIAVNSTPSKKKPDTHGYEVIMRSLRAGVCLLDCDGNILYINESAESVLGSIGEIAGKSYSGAFFGKGVTRDDPRCGPIEFTLAEGETTHVNSETLVRNDGSVFLAEFFCMPVIENDRPNGAVLSFSDVTDRKDVEDAFSTARDDALDAARSKAEFLANMSHEIRTPLTGIIGTVDLLSRTGLNEEQTEFLRMLRTSTNFLHTIVNDILDYSKIEAGKFTGNTAAFSLRELAENSLDPYRAIAADKKLQLHIELEATLPKAVKGDAKSIQQILNNLLNNAIKFTDSGSISLSILSGNSAGVIRFAVMDTGIGIPAEEKKQLFEPFTQTDSSDLRRFGGTGLGLAISRRLVNLIGGQIGFESKENEGTEFWFEIPLEIAPHIPDTPISPDQQLIQTENQPSILVVEDNPINMRVIRKMLSQIGLDSDTAENGKEAIEACRKKHFDIVFMDCQMPEMDGHAATRKIRELGNSESKIIAFSASTSNDDLEKTAASGMNGVLRKPFTETELIEVLNTHLTPIKDNKILDLQPDFIEHSVSQFVAGETLERFSRLESEDPRGFLIEILDVFVGHAFVKMSELQEMVSKKDRAGIRRIAHNLKGSSANCGITGLSGLFDELEELSVKADWDKLEAILHKINGEFEAVRTAITGKR